MLVIPEQAIRGQGPGNVLAVCWRQWRTERALARRGVHFRDTDVAKVAAAYAAMSEAEFDAVNGRQDWANWRTIPRALSGHVPDRPLRILDLGCGTGSSTQVLAHYGPAGSHLTGYEVAEPLLVFARRRRYRHRDGTPARVDFVCRSLTEPFPEPAGGADVVNASGVIGHHFDRTTVGPLIAEIARVLAPAGVALLDVGPALPKRELTAAMAAAGFAALGYYRSWFGDPNGAVVFQRRS